MKKYSFSPASLPYTAAVMLLAPALRLFPTVSAEAAGSAAWLCAPAAFPLLAAYAFFLDSFMSKGRNSEGLAELIKLSAGKFALIISAVWLLIYAAFVLRAGADRFITTAYPGSSPTLFIVLTGIAAFAAALGSVRSIVRSSRLVFPIVFGILIFILIAAVFTVKAENLLPVRLSDTLPILKGSLSAVDVSVCVMYAVCFLRFDCGKDEKLGPRFLLWVFLILLLMALLSTDITGNFGAGLTVRLTRPFFSMVRNLVFFGSLERMEALVVALWIFPDFITVSVFLYAAQHCLRLAFSYDAGFHGQKMTDMSSGRYIIWFASVSAICISLLMAPDQETLTLWSVNIIPKLNMLYAFFFLPAVYIIGRRKKVI